MALKIESRKESPFNSVVAGIATSIVNPYFLLWWATVGAALIAGSMAFGRMGLAHGTADLGQPANPKDNEDDRQNEPEFP